MIFELVAAFGLVSIVAVPILEHERQEAQERKRGKRRASMDELRPVALAVPDRGEYKCCYTKNIAGQGSLASRRGLELDTVKLRKGIPTRWS